MQRADSSIPHPCSGDATGAERVQRESGARATPQRCVLSTRAFRLLTQGPAVLKSLNEFYDDARTSWPPLPTPNEPEFRAYNILTHLRDPDIIWSTELLPRDVLDSPLLQTALSLHSLAQRSNIARGERASPNAFSRFFKLIARPEVPYLFGCILSTHFAEIRKNALETMRGAYVAQHALFPARTLAKVLGCDGEDEVAEICTSLGLEVREEKGRMVVELHKGAAMKSAYGFVGACEES